MVSELSWAHTDTLERLRKSGRDLRESDHIGSEYVDKDGKTYDQMGNPKASEYWNGDEFKASIDDHLNKSNDYTVIDMTDFTVSQQQEIRNYIQGLPQGKRDKIIKVGF